MGRTGKNRLVRQSIACEQMEEAGDTALSKSVST